MSQPRLRLWRCIAAVGGGFGLLAVVVAALVLPWMERDRLYAEQVERLTDQLERYKRLADTLPGLEGSLARIENDPALGSYYLPGQTDTLAAAELQNRLKQMVEGSGGTLVSSQLLPSTDQEDVHMVSVSLRLNCSTDELLDILYKIENARPLLFVDTLSVREQRRRRRRGQEEESIGDLSIRIDVYGYVRRASS